MSYPDHHPYRSRDILRIEERFSDLGKDGKEVLVLTTEKDAMRLRELSPSQALKENMHAIRIHVHFLSDDKAEFDRQIRTYVSSNKRSSILYSEED
jgi:tetraacyldisaccharide 4'-kinase